MKNFLKNSDSTDLLLDAMCNVFGVVLLVAIIIGGLSISRQIISGGSIDREAIEQAQKEYALLTSQLKSAQVRRQLLQDLQTGANSGSETVKIDRKLEAHQQQLIIKANILADKIETLDRAVIAEKALQNRLKTSSIDREKEFIHKINQVLAKEKNTPATVYGVSSTDSLAPLRFIVDNEKIYYIGSNQDIYQGSTEKSAVNIRPFKQSGHRFFHISKRPDKGIKLEDFSVSDRLHSIPPDQYFVELSVESNAVAAAAGIITQLRQSNVPFAWRIIPEDGTVLRTAGKGNYEVSH